MYIEHKKRPVFVGFDKMRQESTKRCRNGGHLRKMAEICLGAGDRSAAAEKSPAGLFSAGWTVSPKHLKTGSPMPLFNCGDDRKSKGDTDQAS